MKQFDIFISYRRTKTADKAEHLLSLLSNSGYKGKVSFDKDNFSGRFDLEILRRVDNCKDFIIILGKDTFSSLSNDDKDSEIIKKIADCAPEEFPSLEGSIERMDFVRIELARAIRKGKNIIPVVSADSQDYSFSKLSLPSDIADLVKYQAVYYSDNDNCFLFQDILPKVTSKLVTKPSRQFKGSVGLRLPLIALIAVGALFLSYLFISDFVSFGRCKTLSDYEAYCVKDSFPALFKGRARRAVDGIKDIEKELKSIDYFQDACFSGEITLPGAVAILKISRKMLLVPSGAFIMGTDDPQASIKCKPSHKAVASKMLLGKYEVSGDEWVAIEGGKDYIQDYPATGMDWYQAIDYCKKLESLCGIPFTLPSEKEWEFAARYGDNTLYAGDDNPGNVAWYEENSGGAPHVRNDKKGGLKCNFLEFYDMSGNVAEWCSDTFSLYGQNPENDDMRVIRGGSAVDPEKKIRITYRDPMNALSSSNYVGFRLAIYL